MSTQPERSDIYDARLAACQAKIEADRKIGISPLMRQRLDRDAAEFSKVFKWIWVYLLVAGVITVICISKMNNAEPRPYNPGVGGYVDIEECNDYGGRVIC